MGSIIPHVAGPIIGALASKALGSRSGSRGTTNTGGQTNTQTGPLPETRPHIQNILKRSEKLYTNPAGKLFDPKSLIPGASKDTQQGRKRISDLAQNPSPLVPAGSSAVQQLLQRLSQGDGDAGDYYKKLLQGGNQPESPFSQFLDYENDPNAIRLRQRGESDLASQYARQFSQDGRLRSPGHRDQLLEGVGDYRAQYDLGLRQKALEAAQGEGAFRNAAAERQLRGAQGLGTLQNQRGGLTQGLAALTPALSAARYDDALRQSQVGALIDEENQDRRSDDRDRHNFNRDRPFALNQQHADLIAKIAALGSDSKTQTSGVENQRLRDYKTDYNELFSGLTPDGTEEGKKKAAASKRASQTISDLIAKYTRTPPIVRPPNPSSPYPASP